MSREQEIRRAVAFAQTKLPDLPAGYADTMVASNRTAVQVKAELYEKITARTPQAISRASMQQEIRRTGMDRKASAHPDPAASAQTMTGREMSRASMEKLIRSRGEEPVSR